MPRTKAVPQNKKYQPPFIIGIDPGKNGAIVCIDIFQKVVSYNDWPGNEIITAKILKTIIKTIKPYSDQSEPALFAALEKVHSMPKQGVASSFSFGTNYGIWRGVLAANEIPFTLISPQTWQKGIPGRKSNQPAENKKAIFNFACQMFPAFADQMTGPRGGIKSGRSDALMIAECLRARHTREQI